MSLSEKSEALKEGARVEAKRLGHRYVGTEHILLAVSREPDTRVSEILIELGLEPKILQEQIDAFVISAGPLQTDEDIPFSPRAQRAFDRAVEGADLLGAPAAEPEHLLLALAHDEDVVAARVLEVFGIDYASIRRFLV